MGTAHVRHDVPKGFPTDSETYKVLLFGWAGVRRKQHLRFIVSGGSRKLFLALLVACLPLATAGNTYGKLPLSFEINQGQTDARVKFLARASGYALFVTSDEAV